MSAPQEYVNKMQAIMILQVELGLGRWVIEKKMDLLAAQKLIRVDPDPADARKLRISKDDVEKLRRALRGEDA